MKVKDAIVVATQYVYIPHAHLKGPGALTSSFPPFERAGRHILAQQIDDLSQVTYGLTSGQTISR